MDLCTNEDAAEAESLMDRDELIDLGYFDPDPKPQRQYVPCDLCQTPVINFGPRSMCKPCEDYQRWHDDMWLEQEAAADIDEHYDCGPFS
jgi:hypothetical protein